jgi:hypothetical protein
VGSRVAVVSGTCAVVGGLAWAVACVVHASQPQGCVGSECAGTSMRESTATTAALVAVAGLMMVVSGVGLLLLVRRRGPLPRTARIGAGTAALGLALLASALTIQALFFDGDFPWMPGFVAPGVLALAVGLVLVGWAVMRSGVVPRWAGVSLVVGAALLVAANEQTSSILLAVPFGLAWVATGAVLLVQRSPRGETAATVPVG